MQQSQFEAPAPTVARKAEGVIEITYPGAGNRGVVTLTYSEALKLADETDNAVLADVIRAALRG